MAGRLKIVAVHGVGGHAAGGEWFDRWTRAIETSVGRVSAGTELDIEFVNYDEIFDAQAITVAGTLEAIGKLGGSGIWHGAGDVLGGLLGRRERRARGLGIETIPDRLRWTAGMVVQWAENESIRFRTRQVLTGAINRFQPDVVLAHSLGSLIAYDTFIQPANAELISGRAFVSFGSQIGNPFVRSQFAGRIEALQCDHWYHLFNAEDDIFTAPIRLTADNFEQVDCFFDIEGFADHDAGEYLRHANVSAVVWRDLLSGARFRRSSRSTRADVRAKVTRGGRSARQRQHQQRALLIGINDYPNPEERLEGCVNDVFLMSEVLQESGFEASQIRTVLNDRATAQGIRDRMEWLLDGSQDGDQRVLYFSGHGSQLTDYGSDETADRRDECLVPWDFQWTRESAIVDDWFHELYSQLPYDARFIVVFDCCHSGGMTRSGLGRPKGIAPRDDVRHRELRWDPADQVWKPRELECPNPALLADKKTRAQYLGESGVNRRLGRATEVLTMDNKRYDATRKRYGHHGPYLPVITQACQEDELAYEYRHGVTSYGAFTYALAQELRSPQAQRGLSMDALFQRVSTRLRNMGYEQRPNFFGPAKVTSQRVKWCQLRR